LSAPRLLPAYQCPPANQEASRAVLVPSIRESVHRWRRDGYPGVTATTRTLLTHWFETDHQVEASGEAWLYYYCQREAMETTVYLYEVMKKRSLYDLALEFGTDSTQQLSFNPLEDRWPRYAYKMATGSGKTKVMSLLIAWSYFNARREDSATASGYSKTFLVLAPNVIVYERLKQDFGDDGKIFRADPVIPPKWRDDWQVEIVTRDEPSDSVTRDGAIFLTNIQQMFDRSRSTREPQRLRDLIGEPVVDGDVSAGRMIRQALERRDDLMVFNDEGHHVHNQELRWSETIAEMDGSLRARIGRGLHAQLDFSATPKHNDGRLFNHVIVDYPIAQAISDGVVKRPHLVMLDGAIEYESDDASARYRDKLITGINRWRELGERMKDIDREPLLFVMTEDTKSADEIVDWLTSVGGFTANQVLLIHTNARGEITETQSASRQREIAALRKAAQDVDAERSPYRVIVSVLMLREGWDVRNVCVIVPLRPYTAASNILPEQTLGRGLRRMFPLSSGDEREELLVIEHEQFRDFWDREIDDDGVPVEMTPNTDFRQNAVTVVVDPGKVPEFEISIPRLSPRLVRNTPDLTKLDIHSLDVYRLEVAMDGLADAPMPYETRTIDTWELVDRGEIERDFPMNEVGYLNYISRLILKECRLSNLSNSFSQLAPKIKGYIEDVMLSGQGMMSDKAVLYRLNDPSVKNWIFGVFVKAVHGLSVEEREVGDEGDPIRVSQTRPYLVRRRIFSYPRKSVFNHVPGDSELELDFARWLDQRAQDVAAFAKNEAAVGFNVSYTNDMGGIRQYIPDFVVRTTSGVMYVIETKGMETVEVARKDARIRQWCKTASQLTGDEWRYVKVSEHTFRTGGDWTSVHQLATASP
jgi:type III restriction enzyme